MDKDSQDTNQLFGYTGIGITGIEDDPIFKHPDYGSVTIGQPGKGLYIHGPNSETPYEVFIAGDNLSDIIRRLEDLESENKKLKEIVERMYYAPGMPGFKCAQLDFDNLKSN